MIVAAKDFVQGKPHPESFLLVLERLTKALAAPIRPSECLVVEDFVGDAQGSIAAGMKCLVVTKTYSHNKQAGASAIISSLKKVQLNSLQTLFEETE